MKIYAYSGLVALGLMSLPVAASNAPDRTGTYVFGGVGTSAMTWKRGQAETRAEKKSQDLTGHAWRVGLGYRFTENFALEAQHASLGEMSRKGVGKLDVSSNAISALGIVPLGQRFEAFAKLQAGGSETTFHSSQESFNTRSRGAFVGLGIGVNAYLTENLAIRAELDGLNREKGKRTAIGDTRGGAVTVGLAYRF